MFPLYVTYDVLASYVDVVVVKNYNYSYYDNASTNRLFVVLCCNEKRHNIVLLLSHTASVPEAT